MRHLSHTDRPAAPAGSRFESTPATDCSLVVTALFALAAPLAIWAVSHPVLVVLLVTSFVGGVLAVRGHGRLVEGGVRPLGVTVRRPHRR
ncbi:hypothetical protein ACFPYI_05750 [Halomarina salina]|uniref:DUF58 domain-containing protein n=1 Tax=Halomarina salina TaxID=1872699 RepID=A0ABD5RKF0_9EURY|nr:hypothetical protein [Halomarina salina]